MAGEKIRLEILGPRHPHKSTCLYFMSHYTLYLIIMYLASCLADFGK